MVLVFGKHLVVSETQSPFGVMPFVLTPMIQDPPTSYQDRTTTFNQGDNIITISEEPKTADDYNNKPNNEQEDTTEEKWRLISDLYRSIWRSSCEFHVLRKDL